MGWRRSLQFRSAWVGVGGIGLSVVAMMAGCSAASASSPRQLPAPYGLPVEVALHHSKPSPRGVHVVGVWRSTFALPPAAKQGRSGWYASRLRMKIALRRGTKPSLVYLSSDTNGYTSTQIKVEVPPRSSRRPVRWTFYGLLGGYESHTERHDDFVLDVQNYLQNKGVRPGKSRLAAKIEVLGPMVVRQAAVLRGTSISSGLNAPAKLEVRADTANVSLTRDSVAVPVRVSNAGGQIETRISVRGDTDQRVLLPGGGSSQRLARLAPGAAEDRTLHFQRHGVGRIVLAISVAGATSSAQDRIAIDVPSVGPQESDLLGLRWPGWLGVVLLAAGAIVFAWPRRSHRP